MHRLDVFASAVIRGDGTLASIDVPLFRGRVPGAVLPRLHSITPVHQTHTTKGTRPPRLHSNSVPSGLFVALPASDIAAVPQIRRARRAIYQSEYGLDSRQSRTAS
jgi:hypothetical protein